MGFSSFLKFPVGPLFWLITVKRMAQLLSLISMQILQSSQQNQPEIRLDLENQYNIQKAFSISLLETFRIFSYDYCSHYYNSWHFSDLIALILPKILSFKIPHNVQGL